MEKDNIRSNKYYVCPTPEKIAGDMKARDPEWKHPRLFCRTEDIENLRKKVKNDAEAASWFSFVKKKADDAAAAPLVEYEIRNIGGLLNINKELTKRIQALSFVWQITRDEKYAYAAYAQMEKICTYPDWVPTGYLELGQMMNAMAFGYDWIYDFMSSEQREYIKKSMLEKGLKRFIPSYKDFWTGRKLTPQNDPCSWWTRIDSNWNSWVNGGAIQAAVVLMEEDPELCGSIIHDALSSLEICLPALEPDGASVESVGYGELLSNHYIFAMAALECAAGTSYGYFDAPGFNGYADFVLHMNGPVTSFNYHDAGTNEIKHFANVFYIANKNKDAFSAKKRVGYLKSGIAEPTLFDIIWYRPELYNENGSEAVLDKYFRRAETGAMRSSFDDDAVWLGFHGGGNDVVHAHLDSGTFVMDALGENWACDLGTEFLTYERTLRFDDRWLLYRISPAGHNTLQIGTDNEYGQLVDSFSPVTEFRSSEDGAYAQIDMSDAYRHKAYRVKRSYALTDCRRRVVIEDDVSLRAENDIWWLMHTPAKIELSDDGRCAYLKQNGKTMTARVKAPEDAVFYAMEAKAMPGMPQNAAETPNTGISKLALCVRKAKETHICVELIPKTDAQARK